MKSSSQKISDFNSPIRSNLKKVFWVKEKSGFNKIFFVFLSFFLLFYFIFSPLFNIPFAHHDNYRYFFGKINHHFVYACFALARPINSIIESFVTHQFVNVVDDLCFFRLLSIFFLSYLATLFVFWLVKRNITLIEGVVISVLIFLFPGIQTFIYMAHLPFAFALVFSFYSYLLLSKKVRLDETEINIVALKNCIFPSILLIISFLTYQSLAFFFLFMLFIDSIFNENSNTKKTLFFLIFFSFTLLIYVAFTHLVLYKLIPGSTNFTEYYKITPQTNVKDLLYALSVTIPRAAVFWSYKDSSIISITIYVFCFLFFVFKSMQYKKEFETNSSKNIFQNPTFKVILLFIIIVFPLAPYILKSRYLPSLARVFYIFSCMLFITAYYSLKKLFNYKKKRENLFLYFGFFLIIITAISINKNITISSVNSNFELSSIYSRLRSCDFEKKRKIHYIIPNCCSYKNGSPYEDIFNVPSSFFTPTNIIYMDAYLKKRLSLEAIDLSKLEMSYTREGEKFEVDEQTLVISIPSIKWKKI